MKKILSIKGSSILDKIELKSISGGLSAEPCPNHLCPPLHLCYCPNNIVCLDMTVPNEEPYCY